jgi:DNA mismatch repair protein MutL
MRTANTEFGHVADQLARLALPHPQVAFTLTRDGRQVHNLPPVQTTAARVADLFGAELADSLLPLSARRGAVGVAGLIGPPSAARASAKWQYTFLNGRYVRDRLLAHALREAYRGLIEPARAPVAFLFIEVSPADVDVNVHPTKIEVRFRDGGRVHGELLAALRETLNRASLTPPAAVDAAATDQAPAGDDAAEQRRQSLRQALADFFKSAPPTQPRLSFPEAPRRREAPTGEARAEPRTGPGPPAAPGTLQTPAEPAAPAPPAPEAVQTPPAGRTLQVHNSYILTADADGLLIIDQHALHERILYNELSRRLAGGPLTAQRLLIPETVQVTAAEVETLRDHADLLDRLGLEVAPFGPGAVAVQQFPALLAARGVPAGEFVRDLVDRLGEEQTAEPERVLDDLLALMACKAAVKAGQALSAEEIDRLLAARQAADKASACPHGRPTTIKLTLKDLQRQFHRT